MLRRVAYLTVAAGLCMLVTGCAFNFLGFERRDTWRVQADRACMAQHPESYFIHQASAINGKGVCGMQYPLKVGALEDGTIGVGPDAMLNCPMTETLVGVDARRGPAGGVRLFRHADRRDHADLELQLPHAEQPTGSRDLRARLRQRPRHRRLQARQRPRRHGEVRVVRALRRAAVPPRGDLRPPARRSRRRSAPVPPTTATISTSTSPITARAEPTPTAIRSRR